MAAREGNLTSALTISNVTLGGNNVPEPGSLALVATALLGLQLLRRRKA